MEELYEVVSLAAANWQADGQAPQRTQWCEGTQGLDSVRQQGLVCVMFTRRASALALRSADFHAEARQVQPQGHQEDGGLPVCGV